MKIGSNGDMELWSYRAMEIGSYEDRKLWR